MKRNQRYLDHILKYYGQKTWYFEMLRLIKKDILKKQYLKKLDKPSLYVSKSTTK